MSQPTSAIFLFFNDLLPKVYSNSLLSSLNSRAGWGYEYSSGSGYGNGLSGSAYVVSDGRAGLGLIRPGVSGRSRGGIGIGSGLGQACDSGRKEVGVCFLTLMPTRELTKRVIAKVFVNVETIQMTDVEDNKLSRALSARSESRASVCLGDSSFKLEVSEV